jgi:hypothetical protein
MEGNMIRKTVILLMIGVLALATRPTSALACGECINNTCAHVNGSTTWCLSACDGAGCQSTHCEMGPGCTPPPWEKDPGLAGPAGEITPLSLAEWCGKTPGCTLEGDAQTMAAFELARHPWGRLRTIYR